MTTESFIPSAIRRRRYRKSRKRHEVARQFFVSARISLQLKHYARIMVVMMPREKWTDERLDEEFTRLDKDIRELRRETSDLRTEMNARFDAMNDSINKRFDRLQYTLIGTAVAIAIAIIGSGAF
jgi:hypothetical protein